MTAWNKKEVARFFGLSVTGLDNWILKGCPVERGPDHRIAGMNVGSVLYWAMHEAGHEIRKRVQGDAFNRHLMLLGARCALIDRAGFHAVLVQHGIPEDRAPDVWVDLLAVAGRASAAMTNAPENALDVAVSLDGDEEPDDED